MGETWWGVEGQQSELPCCDSLWWGINRMSGQGKSSTKPLTAQTLREFLNH